MNLKLIKFKLNALLVGALVLFSCEKPSPDYSDRFLELSLQKTNVSAKGGTQFLKVESNCSWTLELSDYSWASLNVTSGEGNRNGILFSWEINETGEDRSLTIIANYGSRTVECLFTQIAGEELPDEPDNPVVPSGPCAVPDWMELPAMSSEDASAYYNHFFTYKQKVYRNYSFIWNSKAFAAPWVAYPLCEAYLEGEKPGRTEAWDYDPLVSKDLQPYMFSGVPGYDRGHQIPSGDRQSCRAANEQTFYFTNMTAQLGSLNQKGWMELESAVRSWSNSLDTLYVVTGADLNNSTKTVKDRGGNVLTVPAGYYKALLGYKKSLTVGAATGGWVGIAFWFDHKAADYYTGHQMTLDQLEQKLGMDFFPQLASRAGEQIATKVESNIDSFWGF